MAAALGFSVHTGWAVVVAVDDRGPSVLARGRIALADEAHDARFVFHAASEKPDGAAEIIAAAARTAHERAEAALRDLLADLAPALPKLAGLSAAKRALPELEKILGSHPLIHTAEGELFREAIAAACASVGLRIVSPATKALPDFGDVGRPWTKDHKIAAALALAALGEPSRRR